MDGLEADTKLINDLCQWAGKKPSRIAADLGMAATTLARPASGKATTRLGRTTLAALEQAYPDFPGWGRSEAIARDDGDPDLPMVGIQHIDLSFGLGASFTDGPVEIEVLQFPKVWVETITSSPPAFLTWSRGRGDSMAPTIHDGDLVLLDRSQRRVQEQDALWAFTIGDVGAIKRLRVKGDRFQILSDNPSVPPDEEPIDFVNIVARVVFVGKRT
ncbi:S24 family peptidase [Sphingomonas sp.]|uniref:S24 family peptidase n=1 Tax=Sphingomonas sp. TaxID=28214 RepID=UPI003BAD6B65